jgi:hypothetical protein
MRELLLANLLETILLFEPMRSHAKLSEAPLDGFLTRMPEVEIFPSPPVFFALLRRIFRHPRAHITETHQDVREDGVNPSLPRNCERT